MKVLVTGATGFNGGYVARTLKRSGLQVRALVRPTSNFEALVREDIEIVQGQLLDPADVDAAVSGCDQVYHFAGVFRTAGHPDSHYRAVNIGGIENVLNAARKHGCERVVHCSTIGVHGDVKNPPATELSPYNPGDIYQRTKVEGEKRAWAAIESGQPVAIVRPCAVYGEGDTRLLKLFRTIHKGQFRMIGEGRNRLHLIHGEDLANGVLECGRSPAALGQVFLLGGPDAPTIQELAAGIARVLDVQLSTMKIPLWPVNLAATLCEAICVPLRIEPPLHRRRVSFFVNHREFDCTKARTVLGFRPQIGIEAGLARTAAWYFREQMLSGPPPSTLTERSG